MLFHLKAPTNNRVFVKMLIQAPCFQVRFVLAAVSMVTSLSGYVPLNHGEGGEYRALRCTESWSRPALLPSETGMLFVP